MGRRCGQTRPYECRSVLDGRARAGLSLDRCVAIFVQKRVGTGLPWGQTRPYGDAGYSNLLGWRGKTWSPLDRRQMVGQAIAWVGLGGGIGELDCHE
jgi:hypothetical protein